MVALVSMLILATALPGCLEDDPERDEHVVYDIKLRSSGPCELVVPIPVVDKVVSVIEVFKGAGNLTLVDTVHGRCARISTDSFIEVRGAWKPKDEAGRRLMTPNLTTMDPDEVEPYAFEDRTLPDRHIWIELPFRSDASLDLHCTMAHPNGISYTFRFQEGLDKLEVGWNEVLANGSAQIPTSRS